MPLCGLLFLLMGFSLIQCQSSDDNGPLPHSMVLDPNKKFHLLWDFNETHITFEAQVESRGYVGIGLSPNGGMPGSAIVTGWVDDDTGEAYLTDRIAEGRFEPRPTEQQTSVLISAFQNSTHTVIRFLRPLFLCGLNNVHIQTDTARLIWAYHDSDPPAPTRLVYHGPNRGTRSVFLLDPYKKKPEMPSEIVTLDLRNRQTLIRERNTFYWCQSFVLPKLDGKHHIIKIEPLIERLAEVHHINLFACYHQVQNSSINTGHECRAANMPIDWWTCFSLVYTWAVGGGTFYYPEQAGFPIGQDGGPTLLLMETHYDNPRRQKGLIDSSGLRLTLTPTLRQFDAGMVFTGSGVFDQMIIPPDAARFRVDGHCSRECLEQAMGNTTEEVRVFAVMLHTHLAGRALRVRHFRYGIEQKVLAMDNNYDFNLQETRLLEPEIILRKGDNLVVECDYSTRGKPTVTFGGLGTDQEMCVAFLLHYPRIPLSLCASTTILPRLMEFAGVKLNAVSRVITPERLRGRLWRDVMENEVNWSDPKVRTEFEAWVNARGVEVADIYCNDGQLSYPAEAEKISYPRILWEYPKNPDECRISAGRAVTVGIMTYILTLGCSVLASANRV